MSRISNLCMEELADELYELPVMRLEKAFKNIYERDSEFAETILSTLSRVIPIDNKPCIRQVGQKYDWRYGDCKADYNGWKQITHYRPIPFDMTTAKVQRAADNSLREMSVWWTGKVWSGRKLKDDDKVTKWKLSPRGM